MKFHLNYTPQRPGFEINHSQKLLLTGSCFAENIGGILREHKFETLTNPSGILFNPLSIYDNLSDCIEEKTFSAERIIEKSGECFSFLHHSSIKAPSKEKLSEKISEINSNALRFLKTCSHLMITFGTAYYYQHQTLNICVANCHKQPGSHFKKKLLSVNEITELYGKLITALSKINPGLKIIFTVSPVKYLKDGIVENNISKATLLLSVHELAQKNNDCFYFPAYELVTDDLRDHRFYKEDMAHVNEQAVTYIWEKFSETYFSDRTKLLNGKINKLNTALKHKTLHSNSEESLKFEKHIEALKTDIRSFDPLLKF